MTESSHRGEQGGDKTFDVVVVGGGINGASVTRELALRGLKVLLLEKNDFASGTSSASSKLIHGGLRYLEQFRFRLVFESCRERRLLLQNAPHLVKPLEFILPIYIGRGRPAWQIRLGMWVYDSMALFRNIHPHRWLNRAELLKREPALNPQGLVGGAVFYDAQMDDRKLCLAVIEQAKSLGAQAFNFTPVTAITENGAVTPKGIFSAKVYVTATGPWSDDAKNLRKGVHIVARKLTQGEAILAQAKRDNRVFFVMPWGDRSLIGTTDTPFRGSPDNVPVEAEDIDYLLSETNLALPGANLTPNDVLSSFAGVRPLATGGDSREERIIQHSANQVSLVGGKYTTFRAVGEKLAERVWKMLGQHQAFRRGLSKTLRLQV
jgi:glycerol-3-phosphate dehydrogenase